MIRLINNLRRVCRRSASSADSRNAIRWTRALMLGACLASAGCSRAFWREQADLDVYNAVSEKLSDPRWASPRLDVTPDPRSRFFDPYDPDHSPLPPDDPAAHALMHKVDGWKGFPRWHQDGDRLTVENPNWLANYGITPDMVDPVSGAYVGDVPALRNITLADAIELSQIHSREYQLELENVYLAALQVTFERFQFGVRYLGFGGEPSIGLTNTINPHGPPDSLGMTPTFGISQLLPAGGQLVVEFANNTLWLFDPDSTRTASSLSFSLVQPLLIGAGRKIMLENLTQSERELLYQLRDLAQFRKTFFTQVVGGSNGFLGLMLQLQSIRNQEDNIRRLERQVVELQAVTENVSQIYRANLDALPPGLEIPEILRGQLEYNAVEKELIYRGPLTEEQERVLLSLSQNAAVRAAAADIVEQIRVVGATLDELQLQSQLASSRNQLRDQQVALQNNLDSFKILLGLPTDMPLGVDDSLLKPFAFIDSRLRALETEAEEFVTTLSQVDEDHPEPAQLLSTAEQFLQLIERVQSEGIGILEGDEARVDAQLETRLSRLNSDTERARVQSDIAGDKRRLEKTRSDITKYIEQAKQFVERLKAGLPTDEARSEVLAAIKDQREDLLQSIRGMQVIQIGLRVELIEVQPYEERMEESVRIALENRVDLMNERALVMDARRQVEIAANRLQSALDLVVEGDVRNSGRRNPVDFRLDQSSFRVGLQFTAPLDQIAERNSYRQALIDYQQARRAYMLAEDRVKQEVRSHWRSLEVLKRNLETSRLALRIAAVQLDAAVAEASGPSRGGGGSGLQGQNLLRALDTVLGAQQGLIRVYIDYERSRLNIHRDMGTMDVGPDGVWNDPFYRNGQNANLIPAHIPSIAPPWSAWSSETLAPGLLGSLAPDGGSDEGRLVADDSLVDRLLIGRGLFPSPVGESDQGAVPGEPVGPRNR